MMLLLWIMYFMGLFVIYLLIGWLLMLIKDVGLFVSMVVNVIVMF